MFFLKPLLTVQYLDRSSAQYSFFFSRPHRMQDSYVTLPKR